MLPPGYAVTQVDQRVLTEMSLPAPLAMRQNAPRVSIRPMSGRVMYGRRRGARGSDYQRSVRVPACIRP